MNTFCDYRDPIRRSLAYQPLREDAEISIYVTHAAFPNRTQQFGLYRRRDSSNRSPSDNGRISLHRRADMGWLFPTWASEGIFLQRPY